MVCAIEKVPRSAAVALEGGARGEQGQDNGTSDTPDPDPVPTGAPLDVGRLRRCSPAHGKREMVGDLVLDDCGWCYRWSGRGGVRADRLAGDPVRHARQSGRIVARRYQRGHGDAVYRELATPRGCSG